MSSLWELAQQKQQPDFQYMDAETLAQIINHRPVFLEDSLRFSFSEAQVGMLQECIPTEEIYLEKKIIGSIHGIAHAIRVMIYAFIIALENRCEKSEIEILLRAAALHDTQRRNDKGDEEHEKRVLELVPTLNYSEVTRDRITGILLGTDQLSEIFKTADALDRYRQPKVKWWIDDAYLNKKPGDGLKAFAFDLVVRSETDRLQGKGEIDSVLAHVLAN